MDPVGVFEYGYHEFLDGPVISFLSVGIRNKMSMMLLMLLSNIDSVFLTDCPVISCLSVSFRTRMSILCILV